MVAPPIVEAARAAAVAPARAQPCTRRAYSAAPSGSWAPSRQLREGRSIASRRELGRLQAAGEAAAATATPAAAAPLAPPAVPSSPLLYSGVIFDMDGEEGLGEGKLTWATDVAIVSCLGPTSLCRPFATLVLHPHPPLQAPSPCPTLTT